MLQNEFNSDEVTNYPKFSTESDSKLLSLSLKKTKQNTSLLIHTVLEKLLKFNKTHAELL